MVPSGPRILLHAEGAVILVAALFAYASFGPGWGWFALLILAPDLAMLGYVAGPRVGAASYNAAHTYLGPAILAALALFGVAAWAAWVAAIWWAHIGFDRMLGYGLKYPTTFKDTHLSRA